MAFIVSALSSLRSVYDQYMMAPGPVAIIDQPSSPLEYLPIDIQKELHTFMQLRTFWKLSRVSHTLHKRILSIIARDPCLLSSLCSELVKHDNIDAALATLALHESAPISLTVAGDRFHRLAKIAKQFANIQSLTITGGGPDDWPFTFTIPPCRELHIQDCLGDHTFDNPTRLATCTVITHGTVLPRKFPDAEYIDIRFYGTEYSKPFFSLEKVKAHVVKAPNATTYWLLSRYYLNDAEKQKELLQKSLQFFPQFIPAQLDLLAFEEDERRALQGYEEIVTRRPDIARAHTLFAKKLLSLGRRLDDATFHFDKAAELYKKERNSDGILEVATCLKSQKLAQKLAHLAYDLMDHSRAKCKHLEQIIAIDPSHVRARLERIGEYPPPQNFKSFLEETLALCKSKRDIPALIFLGYGEYGYGQDDTEREISTAAFNALKEFEPEAFSAIAFQDDYDHYEATPKPSPRLLTFIDIFLQKGWSVEPLIRPWVYCWERNDYHGNAIVDLYDYLIKKELEGGALQDLSYIPTLDEPHKSRFIGNKLLHRLEVQARSDPAEIFETIPEVFNEPFCDHDRMLVFLFLYRRKLYPEIQRNILESIVGKKYAIDTLHNKHNGIDLGGLFVLGNKEMSGPNVYDALPPRLLALNAQIALAHLLLDRDLPRAIKLFQKILPLFYTCNDRTFLEHYAALFESYSIFPADALAFRLTCLSLNQA